VPEAVTFAREKAGLTKRALAEAVGISEQLMGEIESGWRSATPTNLSKIADALNCPIVLLEANRNSRQPPSRTPEAHHTTNRSDPVTTLTRVPETLIEQEADLLSRLKAILDGHPAGGAVRILLAPTGMPVAEDEVLVQEMDTDRGVVQLRPRKLSDVNLDEVLHDTQILNLDEDFARYAAMPVASYCWKKDRRDGRIAHFY
jgi:transcriptional regulator with XRE-family HTH domain